MKTLKNLIVGLFISFLFLALLEGSLRIFSFQEKTTSVYNSFFQSKVFAVDPENSSMIRTNPECLNLFHDQQFPQKKKKESLRVFSLGGSSTYGWGMEQGLEKSFVNVFKNEFSTKFPEKEIEVINGGGIGYGSFRTVVLMKDLIQYQPDLFLIYAGHNEFWEYPIYNELYKKELGVLKLSHLLSKLKIWTFLRDFLITEKKIRNNVPTLFTGHYEVFDNTKFEFVKRQYKNNLNALIDMARASDVQLIFSTLPANLLVDPSSSKDYLQTSSHHRADIGDSQLAEWEQSYNAGIDELKGGNYTKALVHFTRAQQIDYQYALTYHYMGKCYAGLGETEEAYSAYWKFIDSSRRLIVSDFNQIIRALCDKNNVPFIDGQKIIENMEPGGITSYKLFIDSMHPNRIAHQLIGKDFFNKYIETLNK